MRKLLARVLAATATAGVALTVFAGVASAAPYPSAQADVYSYYAQSSPGQTAMFAEVYADNNSSRPETFTVTVSGAAARWTETLRTVRLAGFHSYITNAYIMVPRDSRPGEYPLTLTVWADTGYGYVAITRETVFVTVRRIVR